MRRPSLWLSRVQLGTRRDKHTKAISAATNSRLENRPSVLFTSQIESIIYIQRSAPSLSEDFRSVNVGHLHCRRTKQKKSKKSDVKRAGLWQCHRPCTCTHTQPGLKLDDIKRSGFYQPPSCTRTDTHRQTYSAQERTPKQRDQSKQRTVKGGRVWQPQRGWPPLLSEKMTLISQSLFRTREEAKQTKMTANPKNSMCCWDTWD